MDAARKLDAEEACPLCGGREWFELFEARGFPIARCASCQVVRTLGAEGSDAVTYPPFDQQETIGVRLARAGVAQLLRERAAIVAHAVPKAHEGVRLLDVGCGSGAFARLMARRGYDVVGVEPFSLGRPTEEPRLRLVRAPLEEAKSDLGRFQVVTMWHVLEHLQEPRPFLESVSDLLEPSGVMVLSVPNFDSWQRRVFGSKWFHLDPPRHVTHFDRATLGALLERVGLATFAERTFHFEYGPVGWLQSTLNGVLRPNFLFEFVKDRGALAGVSRGEMAWNLLASGAIGAGLTAPLVAVESAAAALGAGGVLTVMARRVRGPER